MKETSLALFLKNKCDLDWRSDTLIGWINHTDLLEFTNYVGDDYLCDGGIDVNLQRTQIAIELDDLLEYAGISPEDLLPKNE